MEIRPLGIEGVFEIIPDIYRDERGSFFESFHQEKFKDAGLPCEYVQDNQSYSNRHVLRGLHFQYPPFGQGKLVRVIIGRALDVVVDIRPGSATFGKHVSCIIDSEKNNMLFIPPGFAHGFLAMAETIFFYKCTRPYDKSSEGGIIWNDPDLSIDWQGSDPVVSDKDNKLPPFKSIRHRIENSKGE